MIAISTVTAGLTVIIRELASSKLKEKTARISRTATLDGGVYIEHGGYTDGDRTLRVEAVVDAVQEAALKTIFEGQTLVTISMDDGLFLGAIQYMAVDNGDLKMTIYIKEKVE